MTNPITESMTKVTLGAYIVRVWREEPGPPQLSYPDTTDEIRAICFKYGAEHCLEMLLTLSRINAIEVTFQGQGVVHYPDWK